MAGRLTENEEVNHRIALVVADVIVKIVCHEVSVPQAVQRVNEFADSLRGKVSDQEVSDARAYVMDYVFSTQETMQKQDRAANGKASHKPFSEMTWDELTNWISTHGLMGANPEADKWYWIRREEAMGPPKIRWLSDPREIGLNIPWNPDDVPWQERQPWRTIKKSLPPAMIDTPEKEEKVAWRIGFLLGYGARKGSGSGNTRIRIGWRGGANCSLRVGL